MGATVGKQSGQATALLPSSSSRLLLWVTCTHIWKCTCGRLRTPCPSSNVFNSKPALWQHCAFKEPCVSLAYSESSQHLYGGVSERSNYFVLGSTDKRLFSSLPQGKRELGTELNCSGSQDLSCLYPTCRPSLPRGQMLLGQIWNTPPTPPPQHSAEDVSTLDLEGTLSKCRLSSRNQL